MCGVIWIIQVVHYPLFNAVGREGFAAYENRHTSLITLVVGPAMLIEAALTGLMLFTPGAPRSQAWLPWVSAALLGVAWLSTALLQVPQHGLLSSGFNETAYRALVGGNWVRTVAWSLKTGLLTWWVWLELKGS